MMRLVVSLFLSLSLLVPLGNTYADSYLNVYSFEQPSPDPGNPFWPFTMTEGSRVYIMDQVVAHSNRTYLPTDGEWMLDIQAGNLVTSVSFTFTEVIPMTMVSFDWAFLAADQVYKFPEYAQNDYVSVTINGSEYRLSDVAAVGDHGDSKWQTFSFLAPSETISVSYSATNVGFDDNQSVLLIDNIRINQLYETPPIPEPETWAMFLAGLGLVGLRIRSMSRNRDAV